LVSARSLWFAVAAVFIACVIYKRSKSLARVALILGVGVGLTDLVTYQVLKPGIGRHRPCHQMTVRLVTPSCGGDYGFPSNHAANAMATCGALWRPRKRLANAALVATAFLVGFSRVYLGVHFPFDVLAGFGFGLFMGISCRLLMGQLFARVAMTQQQ
jgi:undecaprenyl-diphosphatase